MLPYVFKPLFYEFMDNYGVLDQDKAYYRLKQIDQDGNFKFSEIVSISINNLQNDNLFKINPNPTNNNVDIKFLNKLKTNAIISIYDINGKRLIMNEVESLESDYNMDLSQLPKGIFNITLESQNGKILQSSRLIKQ
ncbi:MAG: T9SS type A sorting domain-containing protein [Saprospiraceae bacterium]|nr:T9SS type A sorting domain-containing protein [Saprospiraceae bacterium]